MFYTTFPITTSFNVTIT